METSQAPPASAVGEAETLVAAKEEDAAAAAAKEQEKEEKDGGLSKRARKRSRYLSPPYTDSGADAIGPRWEEQDKKDDDEASLLLQLQEANLAAADMLSALHGAALFDASPNRAHANAVDADVLLRFFTLYRSKVLLLLLLDGHHRSSNANAAGLQGSKKKNTSSSSAADTPINILRDKYDGGSPPPSSNASSSSLVGHKLLSAVRAMSDADGSAGKSVVIAVKKEDDATENAHHTGGAVNAAAALEAGHKRRKMAATPHGRNAAADFSVQATNSAPPMRRRRKKKQQPGHGGQHSPAALVLDFTQGTVLPSKEELLSAFRKYGSLIESETGIAKDTRRARLVFGTGAEAEAAYSCAGTLGAFGPPFATPRVQHLPPVKLNAPQAPSPAPKLPLTDIRKNLEKMISSLTRRPSSFRKDDGAKPAVHNLVGEMQGLLAKVDKMLGAGLSSSSSSSSSTTAFHHH